MNTLSLNEFSLLNKEEKIKAFEKIKNSIELQKQHYFNYHKDEDIPIRFYYPQENYSNFQSIKYNTCNDNEKNNNQNNVLLSSSSFTSNNSIEKEKKENLIKKAKNNVLEVKKEMEKLKKLNKYKKENNELNNSDTIHEINYIIESTTNSFNSTKKSLTNNINNYVSGNPSMVNGLENNDNKKSNKIINYGNLYKDELKNLLFNNDNNINLSNTHRRNEKKIYNEYTNIDSNTNNFYNINGSNFINKNNKSKNKKIVENRVKDSKNILYLDSEKKSSNNSNKHIKLDLKGKFDKEYFLNQDINSAYFNDKNTNNKKSRNSNKNIRYKSLSNQNKINSNDISNKLYNMQKIINDKINKKKQELEQKEMKNCTFMPKIDYNSKKIVEKLEKKNKNNKRKNEKNHILLI